jgi:hypothetical protein
MSDLSRVSGKQATDRSWLIAATADIDFLITALFCAVGLLVTINVLHHFPNFVAVMSQLN